MYVVLFFAWVVFLLFFSASKGTKRGLRRLLETLISFFVHFVSARFFFIKKSLFLWLDEDKRTKKMK